MSWWGAHPVISKADARAQLSPAACRHCVYAMRSRGFVTGECSRCGNPPSERAIGRFNQARHTTTVRRGRR